MSYSNDLREEELKNKIAVDYFKDYDLPSCVWL